MSKNTEKPTRVSEQISAANTNNSSLETANKSTQQFRIPIITPDAKLYKHWGLAPQALYYTKP